MLFALFNLEDLQYIAATHTYSVEACVSGFFL